MRIPTTKQIRDLEEAWISSCDDRWGQVLMEVAGRGAAIRALRMWQDSPGDVVVVAGKGNNGGDGLVIARYLTLWGVPCSVWIVTSDSVEGNGKQTETGSEDAKTRAKLAVAAGEDLWDRDKQSGAHGLTNPTTAALAAGTTSIMRSLESQVNGKILESLGVPVRVLSPETIGPSELEPNVLVEGKSTGVHQQMDDMEGSDPDVDKLFLGASLIVDGLFGTGIDRPVEGIYQRVIDAINRSGRRVLSIDVPSGLNSDNGQVMGVAVRADTTVTFGFLKPGLVIHPGATIAGDLKIVDIGLPEPPEGKPDINLSTVEIVREMMPLRPVDSHKGTFGYVLVIAGSVGMAGAAMMASTTALKVGAGLCYLATPDPLMASLPPTEVIYKPMPSSESGTFSRESVKGLQKELDKVGTVILGPGIGLNDDTKEMVQTLIKTISCPCLVDADGLNAIAEAPESFPVDASNFVMTPHPKELSRLLGMSTAEIQQDRVKAALTAAEKFNCTIVLKGAMTVIANPDHEVFINPTGNAGMATAGSGDVLSGTIGGLLAQGVEPFQAAVAGAYLHGRAGDLLAADFGTSGFTAGDILDVIPLAMKSVSECEHSPLESMLFEGSGD